MSHRNILIIAAATAISYACYVRGEQNPYARYVANAYRSIDRWSLEKVSNEQLFGGAVGGMVAVLNERGDRYSAFIPHESAQPFQDEMRQQFGGIGVRIRLLGDPPRLTVIEHPRPDTPAHAAGMQAGDWIVAIDGESTRQLDIEQILTRMRGEVGTPLRLTVSRGEPAKIKEVELLRAVIMVESIRGDRRSDDGTWEFRLPDYPQIGYVRITTFANKTVSELDQVLSTLTTEGVDGIVLDLRNNAGGSLDTGVAVSDMFLSAGLTIVSTKERDSTVLERRASTGSGPFQKVPLVLLIDHNTASASEIMAACLQDHQRAVVAGERSFGKGTVQRLVPTEAGRSILKLTSASFWRPNGKNIHRRRDDPQDGEWGVTPNDGLDIPLSDEQRNAFYDYRAWRDRQFPQESPTADAPDLATAADLAVADDYVDRALHAAVQHLLEPRLAP